MTEFEVKLEIPADRLQEVAAALRKGSARQVRLLARYYDTEGGDLAAAGVAVRLRREGRTWVQTAKAAGKDALERIEHNVSVAGVRANSDPAGPAVSLVLHEDDETGAVIRKALGVRALADAPPLVLRYTTDVTRLVRRVRIEGGMVEIALDRGKIESGEQQALIREIEFESVAGDPAAAIRLARRWRTAHGLWLNTLSKAGRGHCLAQGLAHPAPAKFELGRAQGGSPHASLWQQVLHACLSQVTANASAVAAGSADPEHVHELRTGLRRLRTALRELEVLVGVPVNGLERALARTFRELGVSRDRWLVEDSVQPRLAAQGGPAIEFREPAAGSLPAAVVAGSDFQNALFDLLELAHAGSPGLVDARREKRVASLRLSALFKRICRDGARFQALDEAGRHGVRKHLKRLRYLAEFCVLLYSRKKVDAFVARLKPAQDALGAYNDEMMALGMYRALTPSQPGAWFGVGWLAAQLPSHAKDCKRELARLAKLTPFWN